MKKNNKFRIALRAFNSKKSLEPLPETQKVLLSRNVNIITFSLVIINFFAITYILNPINDITWKSIQTVMLSICVLLLIDAFVIALAAYILSAVLPNDW